MRPRPERKAETANAVGMSASATTASAAVARVHRRAAVHRVRGREGQRGAGRDERRERERLDPVAQGGGDQHVGGVERGRREGEQRARAVDGAQAVTRDQQPDSADGEAERDGAAAREPLAAEDDRARHDEHGVAVRDDAGGPGAHPLDGREIERRGRRERRRAERHGDQADAQVRQRTAQQRAAPARARSRPARSGSPAAWWCRRARAGRPRRALRRSRTPRPTRRIPRDRDAPGSPAGLAVRLEGVVRAVGAAEQQKQSNEGVRHDRLLRKWL